MGVKFSWFRPSFDIESIFDGRSMTLNMEAAEPRAAANDSK